MTTDVFYLQQSETSKVSAEFAAMFSDKPDEIVKKVRSLIYHPWETTSENFNDNNYPIYRSGKEIENTIKAFSKTTNTLTNKNIYWPIPGDCAVFSSLTTAVLREKGIPARSRCGFAIYFARDFYSGHWISEFKNSEGKWQKADSNINKHLIKTGEFIDSASAWKMVRNFDFDPSLFGLKFGENEIYSGFNHLAGTLIRDMYGLLKDELKTHGSDDMCPTLLNESHKYSYSPDEFTQLDKLADAILAEDLETLKQTYEYMEKTHQLSVLTKAQNVFIKPMENSRDDR